MVRKMAKRELIDKDNFWIDLQVQTPLSIAIRRNTVTEQEIAKPYLDKLKHQIHEKTFESGMMNPIMTYAEIMYMIDNLLSKESEEE